MQLLMNLFGEGVIRPRNLPGEGRIENIHFELIDNLNK